MARQHGWDLRWAAAADQQFRALEKRARQAQASRKAKGREKASKPEGLFKQVVKAADLLRSNPRHPGLQTHVFRSLEHPWDKGQKVFEAYAQSQTPGAYRIFWCYGPEAHQLTIIAITPHP